MKDAQTEQDFYENPQFWDPIRYKGPETERAKLTMKWIPYDVDSILDVGCGNGVFTNLLSEKKLVIGLDRSISALKHVKSLRHQADIASLPYKGSSFDMVVAMEVIEHLPTTIFKKSLLELSRVSQKYVLITVPYEEDLTLLQVLCPQCGCIFHCHRHMRSFNQHRLENLFQVNSGHSLIQIEPIFPERVPFLANEVRRVLKIRYPFPWFAQCPQCFFRKPDKNIGNQIVLENENTLSNKLKSIIKKYWPIRQTKFRWWIALYAKGEHHH